jgi:hypothetical protein
LGKGEIRHMPICGRGTDDKGVVDTPLFGLFLANIPQFNEWPGMERPRTLNETRYTSTYSIFECSPLLTGHLICNPNNIGVIVYQPQIAAGPVTLDVVSIVKRPSAATLAGLRRKIASLAHLGANWDGEGGEAPSPDTVGTAEQVTERIAIILERRDTSAEPSVLPFPDGSIFFKLIQGQKELAITILGRTIEAQRWQPLDAFRSEGLWDISVDDIGEHIEWVLT